MSRLRDNWIALVLGAACVLEGAFILNGPQPGGTTAAGSTFDTPGFDSAFAEKGNSIDTIDKSQNVSSSHASGNVSEHARLSKSAGDSLADVIEAIKSWDASRDAAAAYDLACRLSAQGAISVRQQQELLSLLPERIRSPHEGERYCWAALCELLPPTGVCRDLRDAAESDASLWVRAMALQAFANAGGLAEARGVFEQACRSHDPGVRIAALNAVTRTPQPQDLTVLAESLGPDRCRDEQQAAVKGLCRLGTPQAVSRIRAAVLACRDRRSAEILWSGICQHMRMADLDRSFLVDCEAMLSETRHTKN